MLLLTFLDHPTIKTLNPKPVHSYHANLEDPGSRIILEDPEFVPSLHELSTSSALPPQDYTDRADPSLVLGDVCVFRLAEGKQDRGIMHAIRGACAITPRNAEGPEGFLPTRRRSTD